MNHIALYEKAFYVATNFDLTTWEISHCASQYNAEEVRQGQKVTISESRAPILCMGVWFHCCTRYKSVPIVFLAISNISSSTVPSTNIFLSYNLADLFDLGQNGGIVGSLITSQMWK